MSKRFLERDSDSPVFASSGRTYDLDTIAAGSNGAQVTSTIRPCRLSLNLIGAQDLKIGNPSCDPTNSQDSSEIEIKVKVEGTSRKSKLVKSGVDEEGVVAINRSFSFEVKDPDNALFSVHLYTKGLLGNKISLGHIKNSAIADFLQKNNDDEEVGAQWHHLSCKNGMKRHPGKVLMQVLGGSIQPEHKVRIFVGTWNVGNSRPAKDLSSWLQVSSCEIIAVGTQECDYQPRQPYADCSKDWMATLKLSIGPKYNVVHGLSRGQMRLVVFVHQDAEKAISEINSGSEATGVGHVMPNKGGLCISFKFWDTGLCFVNCHLAAHVGQCETRNSNVREIVSQLDVGLQNMDILNQFHHVFWMGDLNYRLDFGITEEKQQQAISWHKIVKQIQDGDHKSLLQYDELRREQGAGKVLFGFNEGPIEFPPTFKMQKNTANSYDQKRLPAWCDRVLWKSLPGYDAELLSYTSAPDITSSDHKPVAAVLVLTSYALPATFPSSSPDDKRWHVRFISLRAKRLRASDMSGFSDPYVTFVGPNIFQEVQSKVRFQTLNPVWNPVKDIPAIVLNTFPMDRLEKEFIMLRVVDYDYASTDDTLGYGAIPLAPAVIAFKKGHWGTAEFSVSLTHHGLPAGTLEGVMRLTWERNVTKRKFALGNGLLGKTLSFRPSLLKRALSKRLY